MGTILTLLVLTHPLTADNISQPTEEKLSTKSANGGGDLHAEILVGGELTAWEIVSGLVAEHRGARSLPGPYTYPNIVEAILMAKMS